MRVTLSTHTHIVFTWSKTLNFNTIRVCVGLCSAVFKVCSHRSSVNVSYNLRSDIHYMQSVICRSAGCCWKSSVYSLQSTVCSIQSAVCKCQPETPLQGYLNAPDLQQMPRLWKAFGPTKSFCRSRQGFFFFDKMELFLSSLDQFFSFSLPNDFFPLLIFP